tara:strand:+ start:3592 stop:3792 length:201 start_codon:yes stop_codon:yes gene_type:complete
MGERVGTGFWVDEFLVSVMVAFALNDMHFSIVGSTSFSLASLFYYLLFNCSARVYDFGALSTLLFT